VPAARLGSTLIHEHVFVGHPELDLNLPHPEWSEDDAMETAVAGFERLWDLGVRTVVDLTVPGLGRDVARVARVAERTGVQLVASTGYYTPDVLPAYFHSHGPGRLVGGPDPLLGLFLRDIEEGIADTGVRAAMLKIVTDEQGLTPDVRRVMEAAATAQRRTGVPITTHTHAPSRNGRDQLRFFLDRGVTPDRLVIGHCGDSEDLDYLRELMDAGATIGMDRFGMEHVLADDARLSTVLTLLEGGYADRMVLSQDAAFFSRVTPPSWRAAHAPNWTMENISRRILPRLLERGATDDQIHQLMVLNPVRVLSPSAPSE
jgi:phosphotriesterase-related protein